MNTSRRIQSRRSLVVVFALLSLDVAGRSFAQGPLAVYSGSVLTEDTSTGHQFATQASTLYIYPGFFLIEPGTTFAVEQVNGGVEIGNLDWKPTASSSSSITWQLANPQAGAADQASEIILPTFPGNLPTTMNMDGGASLTATISNGILIFVVTGSGSSPYHASFQSALEFDTGTLSFPFPIPAVPLGFFTVPPCRLLDTRLANGPALQPGTVRTSALTNACGVPATAQALSVNVTVVGPTAHGDLRFFPGDMLSAPLVSDISFDAGQTRANNAIVKLAGDGSGTLKVKSDSTGPVNLVLDVNGYFDQRENLRLAVNAKVCLVGTHPLHSSRGTYLTQT